MCVGPDHFAVRVGMVSSKDGRAGGPDLREWFAGVHQAGLRRTAVGSCPAGPVDCLLVELPDCRVSASYSGPGAWTVRGGDGVVTVFACGDVMRARCGPILPHPGDPELRGPTSGTRVPT